MKNTRLSVALAAATYVGMIVMNILANALPLNGVSTGAVSNQYFNLFAPTGLTFAVWGVIYVLLGAYVVQQIIWFIRDPESTKLQAQSSIRGWLTISSLANLLWIFTWHYRLLILSVLLMLVILGSLILISFRLSGSNGLTKTAFGVYFGWITVATVANVTTMLVRFGAPDNTVGANLQTIAVLLVALGIVLATLLIQKNIGYGLVVLWAFIGILIRHVSPTELDYGYRTIVSVCIFAIVLLGLANGWVGFRLLKKNKVQ